MDDLTEEIKEALRKKALGYDYEESEVLANKEGKVLSIKKSKKHSPPDTNALKLLMHYERPKEGE